MSEATRQAWAEFQTIIGLARVKRDEMPPPDGTLYLMSETERAQGIVEQAVREEAKRKVERLEAALFKIVQKAPFADREELSKIARRALTPSPEPPAWRLDDEESAAPETLAEEIDHWRAHRYCRVAYAAVLSERDAARAEAEEMRAAGEQFLRAADDYNYAQARYHTAWMGGEAPSGGPPLIARNRYQDARVEFRAALARQSPQDGEGGAE